MSEADKDQLTIPLPPGEHRLAIARRGFEPFDKPFMIWEGQDVVVAPKLSKTAQPPPVEGEPKPEPAMVVQEEEPEPPAVVSEEDAAGQAAQERLAEYEAAEARYASAVEPVEALAQEWDFRGALAALERIEPDTPEMAARLTARGDELGRLAELKGRIIEKINAANPPFRTRPLMIRGQNRDIVRADEEGLTTKLDDRASESLGWSSLEARPVAEILEKVAPPGNGEEFIAAGLLSLTVNDVPLAGRHFQSAQAAGLDVGSYQTMLATAAFARARQLLADQQFSEADAALSSLEANYTDIPWLASNEQAVADARSQAKAGIFDAEAEALYQEAVALLNEKQLFDLKPIIEKLKADYPTSLAVTYARREPSITNMEEAVANLGEIITVRLDGQGDFRSIQAAIDAVSSANSLVEIQDDGPYLERLLVSGKVGLTIRGKRGCWPIGSRSRGIEHRTANEH